ncbi:hypothetical protein HOP50_17g79370 [Chloropicon primus]|uniref:SnoaL-like domain-containing protein n=1 Tax=Chloropicon primus TaxID=1764295 RepID=A0A5B8MXW2_9CHLO|nr:hypothetical protein A3770_17p79150 [Chloropicon primus]UPR04595.1 hypothetical protein HOP50_17g79370 [Chloropicon primus]|eukprot:QDZ25397.1 hypothetical protein A3770_17p79150 [Chloropicon primus]
MVRKSPAAACLGLVGVVLALLVVAPQHAEAARTPFHNLGSKFHAKGTGQGAQGLLEPLDSPIFQKIVSLQKQYSLLYNTGKGGNYSKLTEMYCGHGFLIADAEPEQGSFVTRDHMPAFYEFASTKVSHMETVPSVVFTESEEVLHEIGVMTTAEFPQQNYYVRWVYCNKMKEWKFDVHALSVGALTFPPDASTADLPAWSSPFLAKEARLDSGSSVLANVTEWDKQFAQTFSQLDFTALSDLYVAQVPPKFLPINVDYGFVTSKVDVGDYYSLRFYQEHNITSFTRDPIHTMADLGSPSSVVHEYGVSTKASAGGTTTGSKHYYYTRWVNEAAQDASKPSWRIDVDLLAVGLEQPTAATA